MPTNERVRLNNIDYYLREGSAIRQGLVQQQSDAFRIQGTQRRLDNAKVNRLVLYDWAEMGIGGHRLRRDYGQYNSGIMRDATADTRWASSIAPALKVNADTSGSPLDHCRGVLNWLGTPVAVWEDEYTGGTDHLRTAVYASGSWVYGNIAYSGPTNWTPRITDFVTHKNRMFITANGQVNDKLYSSTSATSTPWTDAAGTGWAATTHLVSTTYTQRRNAEDRPKRLCDAGDTLYHAGADIDDGSNFTLQKTTDSGSNWSTVTTTGVGSNRPPRAFVMFPDPTTAGTPLTPTLVFNTGVYTLDVANSVLVKIPNLNLGGGQYDGFNATVGADGALWIPTQNGPLLRVEVLGQGSVIVERVTPGGKNGDGLVSTRQGYVTAIYAGDPDFLYVAYGGRTGGRTASVFAIRYIKNEAGYHPWHSIYSDSTTNRYVYHIFGTPGPDNTPRIHIVTEASGASVMQNIAEYIYSPLSGVTQSRQTAYVEFAEDDLGDPHTNSGIFEARLDAEDLTASNETVTLKDSIVQGEAWTTNTRGTFTDTVANLSYSGGLGISSKIYKPRLELNVDGTNTNFPKVHELEIAARVRLQTLYYWEFDIDLAKTANLRRNAESIIKTEIDGIVSGAVAVPFEIGQSATRNVEVTGLAYDLDLDSPDSYGGQGRRTGFARVRVEEVV